VLQFVVVVHPNNYTEAAAKKSPAKTRLSVMEKIHEYFT